LLIQDAFSAGEEEKRFAHGVLLVVPDRRIGSKSRQFYCWREVLQGRSCMQKKSSVILHLIVAAWAQSVPQSQMNPPKRAEISMWEASRGQLMSHEQPGNWQSEQPNFGENLSRCLDLRGRPSRSDRQMSGWTLDSLRYDLAYARARALVN
jgi:hypothetical protein